MIIITKLDIFFQLDHVNKIYQPLDELIASHQQESHAARRHRGAAAAAADGKDDDRDVEFLQGDFHDVQHATQLADEVDNLMSTPIADTSSPGQLEFTTCTTGYFMWKKDKVEQIGEYAAKVFDVANLNVSMKKRFEHMSADDIARHEKISSMFGFGANRTPETAIDTSASPPLFLLTQPSDECQGRDGFHEVFIVWFFFIRYFDF